MSAPAVPTSASPIAPTTKVESTQEAPHGQSVSQIGTGGPPSEEAMVHAGAINTIDLYMRMQFLALAMFRWDTAQPPGTLLWSSPISPTHSHQFIRHLKKMYNTWVGGFDYNIKVCGTGFHAGALAVVRLPPNISPSSISSAADFTAFEYLIIDPKTLEVVTEHIIDQRRMMYHYADDEGRDSIGGHIAVYVLVQLNTSSTGSQSIAVQVLTRPSHDFNFFQIKPLEGVGPEPEPDEPITIAQSLIVDESLHRQGTSLFDKNITDVRFHPSTQVKVPASSLLGCYDFKGNKIYQGAELTLPFPAAGKAVAALQQIPGEKFRFKFTTLPQLPIGDITMWIVWKNSGQSTTRTFSSVTKMTAVGEYEMDARSSSSETPQTVNQEIWYSFETYSEAKLEPPLKLTDESYVTFNNAGDEEGTNKIRQTFQPAQLAAYLKTGKYSTIMTPQECMIVDMYDKELEIPVHRLKIYYSGIITTKAKSDTLTLPANKYTYKFVQYSRISEPIPAPPNNYALNARLSLFGQSV